MALQIGGREDKLIWAYTNHGAYTVKSGYGLLVNAEARRNAQMTVQEQRLLTLKQCPKPAQGFSNGLEANIAFLFDALDGNGAGDSKFRSIPWVLWNVWKNRNALLYAETQNSPSFWVLNAEEEATLWFEANKQAQHIEAQSHRMGDMERWCPPSTGTVKCNIHVNWRSAALISGGAWIARDHTGNVLFHGRDAFTPSSNRMIAELRGILWVMQSARDLYFHSICIASDHRDTVKVRYVMTDNAINEKRWCASKVARDSLPILKQ
ncbi:hypothetical protein YC2023_091450 [Brassica napus]